MHIQKLISTYQDKTLLILGLGREGISSYKFFRKLFPTKTIGISDQNTNVADNEVFKDDANLVFYVGEKFLEQANKYDVIIKTPGIANKSIEATVDLQKVSCQTDIFLELFKKQTIGITGTKGKSTTTFLIYETLKSKLDHVLLAGNMGIPLFDIIPQIQPHSWIVCEFSSHQLQQVNHSPHIAILLNIFEEHLDHYHSYKEYQLSKLNIALYQEENDYFIFNHDNEILQKLVEEDAIVSTKLEYSSKKELRKGCFIKNDFIVYKTPTTEENIFDINAPKYLQGEHNLQNIMAMVLTAKLVNLDTATIQKSITTFKGLEHRMEFVGEKQGILFYNDSISTIPEATIAAVESLKNVDTLLLGGFDRGIHYQKLADFLHHSSIRNLVFVGEAGKRILNEMQAIAPINQTFIVENDFPTLVAWAFEKTPKGKICLLSPAAASFDQFKNFEERGKIFKQLVQNTQNK